MKNGLLLLLLSLFLGSLAFSQQQNQPASILKRLDELERRVAELTKENASLKEKNKCFSYYTMKYNKPAGAYSVRGGGRHGTKKKLSYIEKRYSSNRRLIDAVLPGKYSKN